MIKLKRFLGLAVVALVAPLLTVMSDVGVTASPAAATNPPCHGYVYKIHKNKHTHKVVMTYWVYCTRHVEYIQTQSFLREGDRWKYTDKDCYDTYICKTKARLRDRPGRQLYSAGPVPAGDGLADELYVKDGPHDLWDCGGEIGNRMSCKYGGHYF